MPFHKLLQLLPQFKDTVASLTSGKEPTILPVHLAEMGASPPLMDSQNPVAKLIINGWDFDGFIINGGSSVNVINEATCHDLGIPPWEPYPFWLRMADTRSVRPLGLLYKLKIVIGGHTFEISAVILALDTPGAYPLLLGRPWLHSTNIKQN